MFADWPAGAVLLQHLEARLQDAAGRSGQRCRQPAQLSRRVLESARDIILKFNFNTQIDRLAEHNLLYLVVSKLPTST